MAEKTNFNMDVLRAHSTQTMEGRFIVSFVALTLLCELKRRMAVPESIVVKEGIRKNFADEFTWNSLMPFLSLIKVIYGVNECRFTEVMKQQHEVADRLVCPHLYNFMPSFFSSLS